MSQTGVPVMRTRILGVYIAVLYALTMTLAVFSSHPMPAPAPVEETASVVTVFGPLCQHDLKFGGPIHKPSSDHDCCDACLLIHAPGLGAVTLADLPFPAAGAEIARTALPASEASARRVPPTSRGPPPGLNGLS